MIKYLIFSLLICGIVAANPSPSNVLKIGDGTASNKSITFNRAQGSLTLPAIRWNEGSSTLQASNDGLTFGNILTSTAFFAPTVQRILTTGSPTGIVFTVTSANATVGATYTNNGNTFTVLQTIVASTTLFVSGTGTLSGTNLAKASGTGDANITFSANQLLATYVTPTSPPPLYIRVKIIGGGGGGAGGNPNAGGNGLPTYFGINLLIGTGGNGGQPQGNSSVGTGGTGTVNLTTGIQTVLISGGGAGSGGSGSANTGFPGGLGGAGPFGGAGSSGNSHGGDGDSAYANTGAGGGGGGSNVNTSGSGGGAGGYVEVLISSPNISSTYYYAVGTGGALGAASGSTGNGGNGAAGVVLVEEHYQ